MSMVCQNMSTLLWWFHLNYSLVSLSVFLIFVLYSGSFLINGVSRNFKPVNKSSAFVIFYLKRKQSVMKIVGVNRNMKYSMFTLQLFNELNVPIFQDRISMNMASEIPKNIVGDMLKIHSIRYKIELLL